MIKNNLPTLKGTKKQIAWAEKIRTQVIKEAERKINLCIAKQGNQIEKYRNRAIKMEVDYRQALASYLLGKDSAEWWINNRLSHDDQITIKVEGEL